MSRITRACSAWGCLQWIVWWRESKTPLSIPRPIFNPNRRPQKPEGFPNLVLQKSLIRKMELHGAVGEQHKRRRRHRRLRHVENLHARTHRHRRPLEIYSLDETVHGRRWDALPPLGRNLFKQRKDFLRALPCLRRNKYDGRVAQKFKIPTQPLFI